MDWWAKAELTEIAYVMKRSSGPALELNYKGDPYYIRNILIVLPPISSQVKVEPLEYNTPGSYIYKCRH